MSTRYNDESHYENHQRAAELHDSAARMPIVSPSSMEKTTTSADTSIHAWPLNTRETLMSIATRLQADMASSHSDMTTSRPWLMSSGKPGAVRADHRRKIGSVPRKNCDCALAL
jgi:hypothetical protein